MAFYTQEVPEDQLYKDAARDAIKHVPYWESSGAWMADELVAAIAQAMRRQVEQTARLCAVVADKARPEWHQPGNCGCGECTGTALAVEAIQKRFNLKDD